MLLVLPIFVIFAQQLKYFNESSLEQQIVFCDHFFLFQHLIYFALMGGEYQHKQLNGGDIFTSVCSY